jgi:hypothetical protein
MSQPFFTSNPGEFTRLEGLYIFEKNPPGFIQGVFLGTVGVAGRTEKGPINTPVEISSEARFVEVFGHRSYNGQTVEVNEVRKFMLNKPFGKVVVIRVAAAAAAVASFTAESAAGGGGTQIMRVDASSAGAWGADVAFKVKAATNALATHFDLDVRYRGGVVSYKNLTTDAAADNLASSLGTDYANLVLLTKLASGRPVNHTPSVDGADADGFVPLGAVAAGYVSVAGADGTIADADYTVAAGPIDKLASYKGIAVAAIAEYSTAATKSAMKTKAAASSDRLFLIWSGSHTTSASAAITDAALYRNDRIVYGYNSPKTFDFDVGTEGLTPPHAWEAAILSQVDVDVNIGEESTKEFTAAITGLQNEGLTREEYISLKEAGISAWEKDTDGGFLVVSALVNDLTPGKTQITRRRSADFIQLSAASRLKFFVKKKNTVLNRAQIGAEVTAFLQSLKDQGRVVEDFAVDQKSVNTEASRAQGIEKVLARVKLIGHMLYLVFETEIGETVSFRETA